MVFTKLSDSDKEQLAIFKAEHGTVLTSSMRALAMRGSTYDDAKELVLSRQIAKAELIEEIGKEAEAHKDLQEPQTPLKPPRKPRIQNKTKTVDKIELKDIPEEEEPDYKHI